MLVGFIGKMGSGKTTACDFLVESYDFTKHNFKDALDRELVRLYPTVISRLSNDWPDVQMALKVKPTPDAIRELKQVHGTEVRRGQDPDYWVNKWINYYMGFTSEANICVDDVRFHNEVDAIKRFGGVIVRVERTDVTDTGTHESETALDDYEADFTIKADKGDIAMIQMSLENIIEKHDTGNGEEDSDNSRAYAELTEAVAK
jgi:hypothetical protein